MKRTSSRGGARGRTQKRSSSRRKFCRFCTHPEYELNYKNPKVLTYFITERGKIIPKRITGNCAFHQRSLNREIKRARMLALIPYTAIHANYE